MILPIIAYGDPVLRKIGKEISKEHPKFDEILENMFETMYKAPGIGLAATQVNIHQQIVVIDISKEKNQPLCLINPKITEKDGLEISEEGCLSVPEYYAEIKRAERITFTAMDQNGQLFKKEADELLAVCIQHELDHLKGKLFIDYLSPLKQQRVRSKMKKMAKKSKT
jgi:peptide deformylase